MFALAGDLLREPQPRTESRPTAFIGSSTEGLGVAENLRALLESDLQAVIWNQGTVFGLGEATLEALERAVLEYDFGIFIFTPNQRKTHR